MSKVIILSNPTGNVTISAVATGISRSITYSLGSNLTAATSNPTTASTGSSFSAVFNANDGYTFSGVSTSSFSVSGATLGTITFSSDNLSVSVDVTDVTSDVTLTIPSAVVLPTFSITSTVNNGTVTGDTQIDTGGTAEVVIQPNTGFDYPDSITVSNNVTYTYEKTTGVINLSDPTGDITISTSCVAISYTITGNITNGSITASGNIVVGGSQTVVINPNAYYQAASSQTTITVTNASITSYNADTRTLTITKGNEQTGDVTITTICTTIQYSINGNITNGSFTTEGTIGVGETQNCQITPNTGYSYPKQTEITITNASIQSYNAATGALVITKSSTQSGTVTISATLRLADYTVTGNITNGSATTGSINVGGSSSIIITPNTNYTLPADVTVTNASLVSYDTTTGVVTVEKDVDQTGNVVVTATCLWGGISVDLSTLSGWANVTSGTHTLKVVSKATGYIDSTGATTTFTKE